MKHYAHHGFHKFVLCLGYKGEMIKEYFYHYMLHSNDVTVKLGKDRTVTIHENNEVDDWEITMVDTGENSLKGARINKIQKYIDDDFMVTYGDGVTSLNLINLLKFHLKHKKIATLTSVKPPARFGEVFIKGTRVSKFEEKPQLNKNWINGGFFVFNYKIFSFIKNDNIMLEREPFQKLTSKKQLMAFRHYGYWQCMDTMRDKKILDKLWREKKAPWLR